MTNFSVEETKAFWEGNHDPFLRKIIAAMELVEDWTFDRDPEFEAALQKFSEALNGVQNFEISEESKFINLLASVKMSRSLWLMQHLDSLSPGSASKLLIYSEASGKNTDDPAGLFLNRNLIFERVQLLSRIFSKDRLALVTRALEKIEG